MSNPPDRIVEISRKRHLVAPVATLARMPGSMDQRGARVPANLIHGTLRTILDQPEGRREAAQWEEHRSPRSAELGSLLGSTRDAFQEDHCKTEEQY
jgi:hypothetical protein